MRTYEHCRCNMNIDNKGDSSWKRGAKGQSLLIQMKGTNSAGSGQVDITSGDVYVVYYTYDANHRKIWHKGAAPVAAPWIYRNPAHQ